MLWEDCRPATAICTTSSKKQPVCQQRSAGVTPQEGLEALTSSKRRLSAVSMPSQAGSTMRTWVQAKIHGMARSVSTPPPCMHSACMVSTCRMVERMHPPDPHHRPMSAPSTMYLVAGLDCRPLACSMSIDSLMTGRLSLLPCDTSGGAC